VAPLRKESCNPPCSSLSANSHGILRHAILLQTYIVGIYSHPTCLCTCLYKPLFESRVISHVHASCLTRMSHVSSESKVDCPIHASCLTCTPHALYCMSCLTRMSHVALDSSVVSRIHESCPTRTSQASFESRVTSHVHKSCLTRTCVRHERTCVRHERSCVRHERTCVRHERSCVRRVMYFSVCYFMYMLTPYTPTRLLECTVSKTHKYFITCCRRCVPTHPSPPPASGPHSVYIYLHIYSHIYIYTYIHVRISMY